MGELQPQDLLTCNFYGLGFLEVVGVIVGIVCRGKNSCGWYKDMRIEMKEKISPSVPQPSEGQRGEYIGCQSPDPVMESGAQVIASDSHRPQQQWETYGVSAVPPCALSSL